MLDEVIQLDKKYKNVGRVNSYAIDFENKLTENNIKIIK